MELPQSLVAQFRSVSLERLERIEGGWSAITQRMSTPEVEAEVFRDVHTLKGEARLVGFADVVLITQRLEDLLFAARRRRYRVHEDVDVVVTMAIQFIRMLLRKRVGSSQGGIDLNGFLKHIDEILTEWPRPSEAPESLTSPSSMRPYEHGRLSSAARQRLGSAAANVFLESIVAPDRDRLRRAWEILATELARLDAIALMPLIRRHAVAAKDLAVELGKEVDVVLEGSDARVSSEVLDAIHSSLLHTLRNAVDHGIETPDVREAGGKPRRGTIRISVEAIDDTVRVAIDDDGAGADVERIRRRASELGLLAQERADVASDEALLDLVFEPGFTVRETPTSVSGRGIGMDAVRATVERLRGSISMKSRRGAGTTVTMSLPQAQNIVDVHRMPSTQGAVTLAIPTTWAARSGGNGHVVDPLEVLGAAANGPPSGPRHVVVFARDGEEHALAIGGEPSNALAVRICPTGADQPFEIVEIDDDPAILLRLDVLLKSDDSSRR